MSRIVNITTYYDGTERVCAICREKINRIFMLAEPGHLAIATCESCARGHPCRYDYWDVIDDTFVSYYGGGGYRFHIEILDYEYAKHRSSWLWWPGNFPKLTKI